MIANQFDAMVEINRNGNTFLSDNALTRRAFRNRGNNNIVCNNA